MGWAVARIHLDWRCFQNKKRNVIYFGMNESIEHFMKKAEVCYGLRKQGMDFIVEAIFKNNVGRADIYCMDNNIAYEIVHTEDITKSGKENYPCKVEFILTETKEKEKVKPE